MKKLLNFIIATLLFTANAIAQTATDGDYRSAASGDWNTAATWQVRSAGSWIAATVAPTATNNVYLQTSHTITVSSDAVCNDLHFCVTTTIAALSVATGTKVSVNGKIRAYTSAGSPFITLGADGTFYTQTGNTSFGANITTTGTGKIVFVGNTRNITNTNEWSANTVSWNAEFALSAGQTGTLITAFKAGNITITSGTVTANSDVSPDGNATGAGTLTIMSGATLNVGGVIQRSSSASATSHFATLDVQAGGTLNFTGAAPVIGASVINFNGTVGYTRAAGQTLATKGSNSGGTDPYTYYNLNCTGSGTRTFPTHNINITVNGTLTLNAGNFLVGDGVANTNTLTMGNGSTINRITGALNANSSTAAPIVRMGTTSTDVVNVIINGTGLTSSGELTGITQVAPGKVDLTIASGVTYTIQNSNKGVRNLSITGTLNQTGGFNITASGTTTINETTTLGASLIAQGTVQFGNVNNKTLTIGASYTLTLASLSTGTGRIADITNGGINSGNSIVGNVTTQSYIAGALRAYRFLGHPFTTSQSMSSLIDNIFVTGDGTTAGTGGASAGAGFDATGTNAASSWWFDNTTNAWLAFTTASDASWTQYAGARVMIRGDRTQVATLTGGSDIPNAVTLDMTGTVNTGNQTISLPTANNYHFVSNPYPSPTDIGTVIDALGTGVLGTQYWVWDPRASTRGAYVPKSVGGGAYSIPMNSAFIVQPLSATSLAFSEANKTAAASSGNSFFRTTSKGNMQLQLLYNDYPADYFTLNLNAKSAVNKDEKDGEKLMNSDMNFYSVTTDGKKLSLDTRPLNKEDVVQLGFSTNVKTSYKIKVASFGIENTAVYLKDNYTHSITQLEAGVEYSFEVTAESASQGANRFELVMKANPVVLVENSLEVKMSPNPVKDVLTVSYSNPTEAIATVRIINTKGQVLQTQSLGTGAQNTKQISLAKYGKGVYTVELTIGKERISKQVVKN